MSKEIELKLTLSLAESKRVLLHPLLASSTPKRRRLNNTYFDTCDFALRRRGIALRLRRLGRNDWVMTVKGGDSGPGGLAQRSEWEAPALPGEFDFSLIDDAELRTFLEGIRGGLKPVFATDFTRFSWDIDYAGSRIELVLDRGYVCVDGIIKDSERVPLCEMELELIGSGSTDALFDLAINLAQVHHLHPEIQSKAERGYVLAGAMEFRPVKSLVTPLSAGMSPVEAFRVIALNCLLHLQRNEAGALRGDNPEFIHQARVAIRRLRSAFRLFSPVLSEDFLAVYSPRWRDFSRHLGEARDWDVFVSETLPSLESAFPSVPDFVGLRERAERARARGRAVAVRAFSSSEYSRLLLAFCSALLRLPPATIGSDGVTDNYRDLKLKAFAKRRLRRIERSIMFLLNSPESLTVEQYHALRIEFKRLRYALDFFSSMLGAKRFAAYQASLVRLQDLLGSLNDHFTASRLLASMSPIKALEPLVHGWIAGRVDLLLGSLSQELRCFKECRPPWRG